MKNKTPFAESKKSLQRMLEEIKPFLPRAVTPTPAPLREWNIDKERVQAEATKEKSKTMAVAD